jgi:phosphoglycolate phosphatase
VPLLAMEARRRFALRLPELEPFAAIPEVLRELAARGYRLHVLSSNAVRNIRAFIERCQIDVFQTVTCERNLFGKQAGLERFLRKHGLSPAEIIYLGDEVRDIEACRGIGVPCVAVGWGFDGAELLESANPAALARRSSDLLAVIEALSAQRGAGSVQSE